MRRTFFWRVTAALRAVRASLDRVPAVGRWLAREARGSAARGP